MKERIESHKHWFIDRATDKKFDKFTEKIEKKARTMVEIDIEEHLLFFSRRSFYKVKLRADGEKITYCRCQTQSSDHGGRAIYVPGTEDELSVKIKALEHTIDVVDRLKQKGLESVIHTMNHFSNSYENSTIDEIKEKHNEYKGTLDNHWECIKKKDQSIEEMKEKLRDGFFGKKQDYRF